MLQQSRVEQTQAVLCRKRCPRGGELGAHPDPLCSLVNFKQMADGPIMTPSVDCQRELRPKIKRPWHSQRRGPRGISENPKVGVILFLKAIVIFLNFQKYPPRDNDSYLTCSTVIIDDPLLSKIMPSRGPPPPHSRYQGRHGNFVFVRLQDLQQVKIAVS